MQAYLRSISALILVVASAWHSLACDYYPQSAEQKVRYETIIEMPKAYLSGILVLGRTGEHQVSGYIVNEFGISILGFTYDETKNKIKIINVIKSLDHWYIKRELKKDLKRIMLNIQSGETSHYNKKRNIRYSFKLINGTEE